jgi:hypothetical protein
MDVPGFVKHLGGAEIVANHCEVDRHRVYNWIRRNQIPDGYRLYLSKLFPRQALRHLR